MMKEEFAGELSAKLNSLTHEGKGLLVQLNMINQAKLHDTDTLTNNKKKFTS